MAGKSAVLTVKILTDASQSAKGLDDASGRIGKFEAGLDKLTPAAAATVGAIALVGKAAVDSASRTEQAMGALDSVFGKNAAQVKKWSDTAAQSVGLSKSEYGELASVIGAQLNNLGVSADGALAGTKDLIGIGSDLAATFGGSTAEAVEALSSALRGEADPAERYGLSLNQAAVKAKLAEDGLTGLTGEAATAAKAQAILELATEQAGGAMGQFARESDSASGAAQIAGAQFEDAKSALGTALLPAVAAVTSKLAEMAKWVTDNSTLVMTLVGVVGTFAAGILIVNAAMKAWKAIQIAWKVATAVGTAVQWAFNAALAANPVGLIIIAVIALIAVFVLLWTKVAGFRNFFIGVWKAITSAATAAWNWIKSAAQNVITFLSAYITAYMSVVLAVWNAITTAARAAWSWISSAVASAVAGIRSAMAGVGAFIAGIWNNILNAGASVWRTLQNVVGSVADAMLWPIQRVADAFNAIVSAVQDVISWISRIRIPDLSALNPFKAMVAPSGASISTPSTLLGVTSPRLPGGVGGYSSGGSSGGITINVNGGLDSADTIARRIEQLLAGRDRRSSGVTVRRRTA